MPRLFKREGVFYCWGWRSDGTRWKESTRQQDREAAKREQRKIERRRAAETDPGERLSLFDALKTLEAADTRAGRSAATHEIRTVKGRHLIGFFGPNFDVSALTPDDTCAYADKRLQDIAQPTKRKAPRKVSAHTVHKELGVLRRAMRVSGLTWRDALMPDLGRYYTPRSRWLTPAEFKKLLLALSPERQDFLLAWCYSGARRKELYGLTAEDVDIPRNLVNLQGTKTRSSARWIPMSDELRAVLARRVDKTPMFAKWTNNLRDLELASNKAGIKRVTPNDLRRTFASWLANAEVSSLATSKLMGHTSTRMVETVYARLGVAIQRDAVSRLPSLGTHLGQTQHDSMDT